MESFNDGESKVKIGEVVALPLSDAAGGMLAEFDVLGSVATCTVLRGRSTNSLTATDGGQTSGLISLTNNE